MGKTHKKRPSPSVTTPKAPLFPAAGPAKECPKRLQGVADDLDGQHPTWRLCLLDREHTDGWSWQVTEADIVMIVDFLSEMERLTWKEIRAQLTGGQRRGAKHKFIPVTSLCPIAQRRLIELELDEFEQMFRFRLGNMGRLWGVIAEDDHVFYPVWWDPGHKVCPSADR
jgi:hypothetical protein